MCNRVEPAVLDTLLNLDPVSRGTANPIAFDGRELEKLNAATVADADAAVRFAYALVNNRWHPHQHPSRVNKFESESTPFIGPLTEEAARALARCQALADSIAFLPPPQRTTATTPHNWPRDADGRYHLRFSTTDRPAERTVTHTTDLEPDKRIVVWRSIVVEVASRWAHADRVGRSAGRVFLGPKDRFIFWPRHLNELLQHAPTTVGRIVDLFVILAAAGVKLDVKSAYRALELTPDDSLYHAALVDSVWIVFSRLSFGMAQSPAMFGLAFGATLASFRSQLPATEQALSAHVDDAALSGTSITDAILAGETLLIAFRRDQWWASVAKTFLWPSVRLLYVGFIVDFANRTARVAPSKAAKVLALLTTVRRPTNETIAAASAEAAPTNTAVAADRAERLRDALDHPGVHTLAMAPLTDSDFPPDFGVGIVRGPLPVTLPRNLVVRRETRVESFAEVGPALAAEAQRDSPYRTLVLLPSVPGALDRVLSAANFPSSLNFPVVFVLPSIPEPTPPQWFHPDHRLPAHFPTSMTLPAAADVALPTPDPSATVDLRPEDFATLTKATGYLSWFQCALPFVSISRAALAPLLKSGRWTAGTAAAFDGLTALVRIMPDLQFPVDAPLDSLLVVTDASSTGWGAVAQGPDGPVYFSGVLPDAYLLTASGAREAVAAVCAVTAALRHPDLRFRSVRVVVDSTVLVGAGGGHARAPDIVRALLPLVAWSVQGLRVTFEWHGRDTATHAGPDALSAAATAPRPWPLTHAALGALWAAVGGWDLDITAYGGHAHAHAVAYATPTGAPLADAHRRAVLHTITPATTASRPRRGWVGTVDSMRVLRGEVAFAWPLWSDIRDVLAFHDTHGCRTIVVAPADVPAGTWWAPHLRRVIDRATAAVDLCDPCTVPPSAGATRDPYPLRGWILPARDTAPSGAPADAASARARPASWPPTPQRPPDNHAAYRAPNQGTPADAAWVQSGHCPKDRPGSDTSREPPPKRRRGLASLAVGRTPHPAAPPPPPQQPSVFAAAAARACASHAGAAAVPTPRDEARPARSPPRAAASPSRRQRPPTAVAADHRRSRPPPPRVPASAGPQASPPPTVTAPPRGLATATFARTTTALTRDLECAPARPSSTCRQRHPDPAPPAAAGAAPPSLAPGPPVQSRSGLAARLLRPPPPSAAPPPTTFRLPPDTNLLAAATPLPAPAPPLGPAGHRRHPTRRDEVVPIPPPVTPGATVGAWCREMLRHAALQPASALAPGVHPAHAPAIATARKEVAQRANEGSDAPSRLPRLLLEFATHLGVADHPWSLAEAEALVLHFCLERNKAKPANDMPQVKHARDILSMASRIAACSSRAGFAVPPHCGPQVTAAFAARGAKSRKEHSSAYPVHMSSLLGCRPAADHPDRDVWNAWFVMALFCLRTGVLFHLYTHMFVPYDSGYILVWRFVQKRCPVSDDEGVASSVGAVTAARHPYLRDIIGEPSDDNRRLFPAVTPQRLSEFARSHLPACPPGYDVRTYGVRTAADAEAQLLGLPDDITRTMFWWKRPNQDMRAYYGGVNIRLMYMFSERRVQTHFRHSLPGRWDGAAKRRGLDNWSTPVASKLPSPPAYEHILRSLRTACPSLLVQRRVRAAVRAAAARRSLGLPAPPTQSGQAPLTGTCLKCYVELGPTDPGRACELCDEVICDSCIDAAAGPDYYCPAHKGDHPAAVGSKRKRARR